MDFISPCVTAGLSESYGSKLCICTKWLISVHRGPPDAR